MVRANSRVFYEIHGEKGPPLLLINGIGFSGWSWYLQTPELARECRVVSYDHRGSGKSPWNGRAFTMADLAGDAVAVLDALKIPRAHVFSISMGGFVGQELALRHPDRVLSLILGCTHCGAPDAKFMEPAVAQRMTTLASRGWTIESVTASLDLNFSPSFIEQPEHQQFLQDYVKRRVDNAPPSKDWAAQREASLKFSSFSRLAELRIPTHVLHGDDDAVVPTENARILHQAIAGSTLRLWECARHAFFLERAAEVNQHILGLLNLSPE